MAVEFGDSSNTVLQTTLASMFPISYEIMRSTYMLPRTPQPTSPLSPEKVRPLVIGPFSLTYTGSLKIADLNTELLFLARSLCAATKPVAGGFGGVIGGEGLLINITFNNVVLDDITTPLVIQGISLIGSLTFTGSLTIIDTIQIGYCSISQNLTFDSLARTNSLELYACLVTGTLGLPSGESLSSLLVYGTYPQILFTDLSNPKLYPLLLSLMYLNTVDGRPTRDIPTGDIGFGAFTLDGLKSTSYPNIVSLAVPDPWLSTIDLAVMFPNLVTLFVIEYPGSGVITIPTTAQSNYSRLVIIGARTITSLDLTGRVAYLSKGIRIVGCPLLYAVILRSDPLSSSPPYQLQTLVIERCALLYLRGARGIATPPNVVRLGDHVNSSLAITGVINTVPKRLLDYILLAMPSVGIGSASPLDYLPNVLVSLAESIPSLILYPVMQTVEYNFAKPAATISSSSSSFTQYNGGANPVVPTTGNLSTAAITVSPFGIRYNLSVSASSNSIRITSTDSSASASVLTTSSSVRGNTKNSILSSLGSVYEGYSISVNNWPALIRGIIIASFVLLALVGIIVGLSVWRARVKHNKKIHTASGLQLTK